MLIQFIGRCWPLSASPPAHTCRSPANGVSSKAFIQSPIGTIGIWTREYEATTITKIFYNARSRYIQLTLTYCKIFASLLFKNFSNSSKETFDGSGIFSVRPHPAVAHGEKKITKKIWKIFNHTRWRNFLLPTSESVDFGPESSVGRQIGWTQSKNSGIDVMLWHIRESKEFYLIEYHWTWRARLIQECLYREPSMDSCSLQRRRLVWLRDTAVPLHTHLCYSLCRLIYPNRLPKRQHYVRRTDMQAHTHTDINENILTIVSIKNSVPLTEWSPFHWM